MVVSLMQPRALGSDRGGLTFAGFIELLAVEVLSHRFRKCGKKVVADSPAVALAFKAAID